MISVPTPNDTDDFLEHLCLWTILGLYLIPVSMIRAGRFVFGQLDKLTLKLFK